MPQSSGWQQLLNSLNVPPATVPDYSFMASYPEDYGYMGNDFLPSVQSSEPSVLGNTSPLTPPPRPYSPKEIKTQLMPDARMDLLNQIMGSEVQGIKDQRQGLDVLKQYAGDLGSQKPGADLSALLALSDSWNKTNLLPYYKKPKTQADIDAEKFAAQKQVMAGQGDISKSELDLLKTKYGALTSLYQKDQKDQDKLDIEKDKAAFRFVEKYNSDPVTKKAAESEQEAARILTMADLNNAIADGSLPTFMARASGEVGNLSEADKRPFGGSRALKARIDQIQEQLKTGMLTDDNRELIRELAGTMQKHSQNVQMERARSMAKQYGKASRLFKEEEVLDVIAPGASMSTEPDKSSGPQVGQVMDGYQFQGGDPSNPSSWIKVK